MLVFDDKEIERSADIRKFPATVEYFAKLEDYDKVLHYLAMSEEKL